MTIHKDSLKENISIICPLCLIWFLNVIPFTLFTCKRISWFSDSTCVNDIGISSFTSSVRMIFVHFVTSFHCKPYLFTMGAHLYIDSTPSLWFSIEVSEHEILLKHEMMLSKSIYNKLVTFKFLLILKKKLSTSSSLISY